MTAIPSCASCGEDLVVAADDLVRARAARERDRTASADDQTSSGADQTASDEDQTWSDRDQTASESDQRSADEDQHAADDDLAAGGDAAAHRRSARARERSGRDRADISTVRDETAADRLRTAEGRDLAAERRDRDAEERDADSEAHDAGSSHTDMLLRAQRDRERAAADRARAAGDRARAAADREAAASERQAALLARGESAAMLELATTDELTGARARRFGLEEVARELERSTRTGDPLVLAFVDVDGLKQLNDTEGHQAGDALLRLVGETIRTHVRPYDVLVRYGGDEFLCALPGLTETQARKRFDAIAAVLAAADVEHSVSFGLAAAEQGLDLDGLIARADADLRDRRSGSPRGRDRDDPS